MYKYIKKKFFGRDLTIGKVLHIVGKVNETAE